MRSGASYKDIRSLNRIKKKIIRKEKRATFRRDLHELRDQPEGIWKLAKWGKERSFKPPEPPRYPPWREGLETTDR